MKIKAALVPATGQPFQIEEVDLGELRSNEILVRIVATGVCHTDLFVKNHFPLPMPAVLGHEGAGIVEQVGETVTTISPGDHVVLSYGSCGHCKSCLKGHQPYCHDFKGINFGGVRSDGSSALSKEGAPLYGNFFNQSSFASHAIASERNVVKVSKDVPLEILGPLGCGIQTGAGAVLNSLKVPGGSSIAVFGAGAVGLSAIMAAAAVGCTTIIAIDIKPERLELAKQLGATHTINSAEENAVEQVQAITGRGLDFSIDTTGIPAVYRNAIEALDSMGVCGLIGASGVGTEVTLNMDDILFGRRTQGIMMGDSIPQIFIPQLIELYKQGRFPFDKLIKFYSIDAINQAVEDTESGATVKPVIRFSDC